MLKIALAASAVVAAGTTVYLVRSSDSAAPAAVATPPTNPMAPLHYGTGAARKPALGPTAPVHASAARSTTIDDLALLPADSELVLGVDVAKVQQSALWQQLVAPMLARAPGLGEFESECGFDPVASLASVTVGVKGTHGNASGAIVIHGFAKAKALACVTKMTEKHHADAVVRTDGDVMLVSRNGQAHAALTFLDDSTALVVLGPDATTDGVAKLAARRGAPGTAGYSELIQEINTDDAVWLAVSDGSPMLAEANRQIAKHTSIQLHGLYGSVDFSDGLVVNAGARTGSPELVAKLVSDIQHHIDDQAHGDIRQRFEQLDVNADGGDVILSLQMNTSQLLALAGEATSHMAAHHAEHHADEQMP